MGNLWSKRLRSLEFVHVPHLDFCGIGMEYAGGSRLVLSTTSFGIIDEAFPQALKSRGDFQHRFSHDRFLPRWSAGALEDASNASNVVGGCDPSSFWIVSHCGWRLAGCRQRILYQCYMLM